LNRFGFGKKKEEVKPDTVKKVEVKADSVKN
jgi:hypothetical protein